MFSWHVLSVFVEFFESPGKIKFHQKCLFTKCEKKWQIMCGEVSGLRDWIIVESRHAKSFSRFLLDTDEAIWITLQTGVDLPVVTAASSTSGKFQCWKWRHRWATTALHYTLLCCLDTAFYHKIKSLVAEKREIFSPFLRAGGAFNIISTRNRYKICRNFL